MTINLTGDRLLKLLQFVMIAAVFALTLWSQPWKGSTSADAQRKITVNGEATIKAEPDEYNFSPYFQASGTDPEALKADLNEKANAAVAKLKELGVEEKDIKVDSSSYDYWFYKQDEEGTLTVSIQVTVTSKDKAQEVQDYFTTLDLDGQLTPQAVFSEAKQKELDNQAVEEASKDAKAQAEKRATLLGAKIGKVISIDESGSMGFPVAYNGLANGADLSLRESAPSLPVLPGQNEYTKTISVTYELR